MQLSSPLAKIDGHPSHFPITLYQDTYMHINLKTHKLISLPYSFIAILESCSMSSNVSLQFKNMEKWYSFPPEQTIIPSVNLEDSVDSFYGNKLSRCLDKVTNTCTVP